MDVREDIDLVLLEEMYDQEHCEVKHYLERVQKWCAPCSHEVVATLHHSCSDVRGLVCQAVLDSLEKRGGIMKCRGCGGPVNECWIIVLK